MRFVSQALGKHVEWSEYFKTVAICENDIYEKNQLVFNSIKIEMAKLKYREETSIDTNISDLFKQNSTLKAEVDKLKNLYHSNISNLVNGKENTVESYIANDVLYEKADKVWNKVPYNNQNTDFIKSIFNNEIAAAFIQIKSDNQNNLVYYGEMGIVDIAVGNKFMSKVTLTIDKQTNRVVGALLKVEGKVSRNGKEYGINAINTTKFFDFNGNFEVTKPIDLKL